MFERLDKKLVIPVFEPGMATGRDKYGPWLYDPVSKEYFREGDKVFAGGGGGPQTVSTASHNLPLQSRIPQRCLDAVETDYLLVLNPGLHHVDFD